MGKKTEVLLLKPLPGKGNAGDVIEAKIHYANHYLLPQGIAIIYDKQVKNQRSAQAKKIEKAKAEQLENVKSLVEKVSSHGVTFYKEANDEGKLYDSIDEKAIATQIYIDHQIHLDQKHFSLEQTIQEVGKFVCEFTFEDVTTSLPILVERKEE